MKEAVEYNSHRNEKRKKFKESFDTDIFITSRNGDKKSCKLLEC